MEIICLIITSIGDKNYMKTHAIIPIFISHKGCPNTCVFCNQNKITSRHRGNLNTALYSTQSFEQYTKQNLKQNSEYPLHNEQRITEEEIIETIETYLSTLRNSKVKTIEIAFYGGSFTAIPMREQSEYLAIAKRYKEEGYISKIHISTRPDYINKRILDNLKNYGVDIIELGVQSFCEDVLLATERGHGAKEVYNASSLIKAYGFELGLQLMIGLPTDTKSKSIYSAHELVKISPSFARLYPTIIIKDTKLEKLYKSGKYTPLTLEEAIDTTKEMYKIITSAGIQVIRIGLKSSDIITESGDIFGYTFHPAFSQLVTGAIAKDVIEEKIKEVLHTHLDNTPRHILMISSSQKNFSNMIGHNKTNKLYFEKKYHMFQIKYSIDDTIYDEYSINVVQK